MITALIIVAVIVLLQRVLQSVLTVTTLAPAATVDSPTLNEHEALQDRIAALELELGFREMTDDEVRRLDHAPPNAIVTEEYRQYATQKYTNRPLEEAP